MRLVWQKETERQIDRQDRQQQRQQQRQQETATRISATATGPRRARERNAITDTRRIKSWKVLKVVERGTGGLQAQGQQTENKRAQEYKVKMGERGRVRVGKEKGLEKTNLNR